MDSDALTSRGELLDLDTDWHLDPLEPTDLAAELERADLLALELGYR